VPAGCTKSSARTINTRKAGGWIPIPCEMRAPWH
jgi:hypothetical protein